MAGMYEGAAKHGWIEEDFFLPDADEDADVREYFRKLSIWEQSADYVEGIIS